MVVFCWEKPLWLVWFISFFSQLRTWLKWVSCAKFLAGIDCKCCVIFSRISRLKLRVKCARGSYEKLENKQQ